ncbi:Retinoic acid induced 16-like protein-domain-containing protein [Halenospora varia]|nr:Retinoic acid induced 16-like protein-domain-containing protein [Halenospora varia]
MDFWSRLIAGTSLAPGGNKAASSNPEKRLARFKREYAHLLQAWRNTSNLGRDAEAADNIRGTLQDLTTILSDESRRPLPHPCIVFASAKQIYIPIGKIATTSYNEGIIREGVAFFATLIDSEEENFVENDTFSRSLMNLLVRITGANSIRLGSDTEVEVVELSFNITTKIRLDPEILPAWFTTQRREESIDDGQGAHEKFTGKTNKDDFPLFYLLIDYIHHEGRIGDFARTGLLYIIEAASNSVALEQWIVESDLATLMATGLGALYSQLSRKLVIDFPPDELPPILALSDYQHPITTMEIVSSASFDFQGHMETFLSHLVFWQDVLNHCKSVEVKQTLLEHFQVIFLQQLLYPSLLESSDHDGGSSVAVLTYLRRILESLDHPDMIHLILHYLLALPDSTPAPTGSRASVSAARKRKSLDLATMMATQIDVESTPALFNLVDLIQGSLQSQSQQTISVTLQLVSVILRRHHRYAVTTLLWTSQILSDGPQRPIGAHEKHMDTLLGLAGNIGGEDNFDEVYENHIRDSMSLLESHPCSITLIAPKSAGGTTKLLGSQASIPGAPRDIRSHTLRPEDPMLKILLGILATFFTNSVETNLSLTGTFVDLATCGFMRIDGWLLPDPSKYAYEDEEEEESEDPYFAGLGDPIELEEKAQIRALKKMRRTPKWTSSQIPAFLIQIQTLVDQVSTYRADIPRFDELLQQRREAFQAASSAMSTPIPIRQSAPQDSSESMSRSSSPPRKSGFDTLAQRIFPELGTPSRSNSPRGRRSQDQQRISGGYGFATPTSSRNPPAQLAPTSGTSSRESSRAFSPSPLREAENSLRGQGGVPASQLAAYAAIDQGILKRKVGIPAPPKSQVTPIPFPNLKNPDQEDEVTESTDEISVSGKSERDGEEKLVSVSHVLTNVLVLQEFLPELAALVQVRAGLFGEVRFV